MNEPHATGRSRTIVSAPGGTTLASVEEEFGWTCWSDGDQCYARRPQIPPGDHDARGEDPADLREAIMMALQSSHDITPSRPAESGGSHRSQGRTTMPASPAPAARTPSEQADLASLATELATRGYRTVLHAPAGTVPCLHITNPRATALTEQVYAQGGSYWYSWGQPIVTCDRPATAAAVLGRVLRAEGE
jgi:hypothetical protein